MYSLKTPKPGPPATASERDAAPETPLPPAAVARTVVAATVILLLFYGGVALALALLVALFGLDLAVLLAVARFGLSSFMRAPLKALMGLLTLLTGSLRLRRGGEYRVALRPGDAPGLFALAASAARRLGVDSPDEFFLEMSDTAWVHLRGYRTGHGSCALGLGFDLLVLLTEEELAAVLAHEMAHARLTQRGHLGWLRNGVARMTQVASALSPWGRPRAGGRFFSAEALARGARGLAERGCRLLAALSRQEEFAADRLAAEHAGAAVFARALTTLHVASLKGRGITWRDRLVQLQRDESFTAWVRDRLAARDAGEWEELEWRALEPGLGGEFSSHPSLRDRLAALGVPRLGGDGAAAGTSSRWAVSLLSAPEATAAALAAEVERVADAEDRRESERIRRWVRGARRQRLAHQRVRNPGEGLGMLALSLGACAALGGLVMLGVALLDPHPATELVPCAQGLGAAAVLLTVGLGLMRAFRYRERELLPVPPLAAWEEATWRREARASGQGAEDEAARSESERSESERLWAEVHHITGSGRRARRARARHFGRAAYEALGRADYAGAGAAARLCLEEFPRSPEGRTACGITAAYAGNAAAAQRLLGDVGAETGVGPSLSAALAWSHVLLGDWANGEAFLHDALGHRPGEATLWSLLGQCQWAQGRVREAVNSVRLAVSREPGAESPRVLLLRFLIGTGRVRDAGESLASLEADGVRAGAVRAASVRLALLVGRPCEARERAAAWEKDEPTAHTWLRLGDAYLEAKEAEVARQYFARALEEGHCPEAHLALARLALDAGDADAARALTLGALDLTRPTPAGVRMPLAVLGAALQGLRATRPVEEGCRAGVADVDLDEARVEVLGTPITRLTVSVMAPTLEAAEALVAELCAALFPGAMRVPGVRWRPASVDQAPRASHPGVFGCELI